MFIKTSVRFQLFEDLAAIHLCSRHGKYSLQATKQWLDEFSAKRTSIISTLEDYYSLECSYMCSEDEIEEEYEDAGESSFEFNGQKQDPDEEPEAYEDEEGVSMLSSQSSFSPRVMRRAPTMQEDEVAKDVTWLLEQPLEGNSKIPGWIYIISPPNLPGILKVGYTKALPDLNRFGDHKKCYGNYQVIATILTPYAYRVEQLLLAEFQNNHFTLKGGCHNCRASHRELLNIDKESLLRSLDKWKDFVESSPYNSSGKLKPEARERIPRPALKSYLGYKGRRRPFLRSPASGKKGGTQSQDSQITPPPPHLSFESPTSTTKSISVNEVELSPDDLCRAMEEVQLTPSKNGPRAKGVFSGRKKNDDRSRD